MADYKFSPHERHAVYTAHQEKCYMCSKSIDIQSMEVDHIIPESLLRTPNKLKEVLKSFSLDESFDLNTPENWLPACSQCNREKSNIIFEPSPIIQL